MVVVPRETPVTRSHLEHLLALHDAGAVVLPASPGFYGAGARASAAQLIDFVAGRVLDALAVPHTLLPPVGRASWAAAMSLDRDPATVAGQPPPVSHRTAGRGHEPGTQRRSRRAPK